ncbi:hypothetical protein C8R45DRAFT_1115324 [Mycena sanguinolenta]|nr:hypothetical protein C8R45DRAFT_1115324 [Mycena sanguinolenta]
MDEVSAQLRAAEMKELAVASRRQALAEKDERARNIFARAGNEELAAEDLEELESILRGESLDNSDVPDETNDEADSEPDPNEVQTGRKRKRVTGRRSSARKAPAKKQRKAETSRKGGEAGRVRKAMRPEEIVWGPAPEPCGRCAGNNRKCQIPTNDPNKAAASGEQAPEDRGSNSAAEDEETVGRKRPFRASGRWSIADPPRKTCRGAGGGNEDAAEIVRREPANKWPRVYLQSINWSPEGEEYPEPEDSSSESSKDSRVKSWRKEVVPEAPEGERLVEEQPDDQMQVDDTPVDGMQVDPPASRSSAVGQPPIVERPEGIKIEVRSPEQMLTDLGRQLARNWLHEQKVARLEKEKAEDAEKLRKLTEQREELEREETRLRMRDEWRKKAAERKPSVKKETEEGGVPPPAPPRPVVRVREVNNVVEILDSDDEKAPEGPEESEDV